MWCWSSLRSLQTPATSPASALRPNPPSTSSNPSGSNSTIPRCDEPGWITGNMSGGIAGRIGRHSELSALPIPVSGLSRTEDRNATTKRRSSPGITWSSDAKPPACLDPCWIRPRIVGSESRCPIPPSVLSTSRIVSPSSCSRPFENRDFRAMSVKSRSVRGRALGFLQRNTRVSARP